MKIGIPPIYLFRKMWRYAQGNHHRVVLYMCMSTMASLTVALEPLIVGLFLNSVQVHGIGKDNLTHLFLLLLLLPLLEIISWSLHGPARMIENKNAFFVRANYKNYLLRGTMDLPIEWHTDHHSGDTIDKIEKGTGALFNFSEGTFEIISTIIQLTTAFAALMYFNFLAGAVALVISLATFGIISLFDRHLVPGYRRVNRMENATSAKVFDTLSNITTIIILRVESLVLKAVNTFIQKPSAQFNWNNKLNEWKWFSASLLGRFAVILVIGIYIFSHRFAEGLLIGTIYIMYSYANEVRNTFYRFASLYNNILRYRASVSNAEDLSLEFRSANSIGANKRLPKNWQKISIRNLSFSYEGKEGVDLHLEDVSLSMHKGERIALIGESGGGKSTFLKLIRDLYHPRTLELYVDDKSIAQGFAGISDSISLIPQDPEIFATTIRENITLGVDEYTDKHIQVFTDMARFTDIIKRLPKELESSIVEKGVNLSGGEKQRLALARGLLASIDKDIILLDEPTSSVDFHNELEIYKNIFDNFQRKTIISSVHRLHLLSMFDMIYFFKGGKIIASGSFEAIGNSSPEFKSLWENYIRTRDAAIEK